MADVKTFTCSKCNNKNPVEAAFCGFCGADMTGFQKPADDKKTMFGYNFQASELVPPAQSPTSAAPATPKVEDPKPQSAESAAKTQEQKVFIGDRFQVLGRMSSTPIGAVVSRP